MKKDTVKILVIGASGQVGGAIVDIFKKNKNFVVFATDQKAKRGVSALDITKPRQIDRIFKKVKPDVVVLTAAFSHVDGAEENKRFTKSVNVEGLANVSAASKKYQSKLISFSSAYVFNGKRGYYNEEDRVSPINYYGKTKVWGEEIVQRELNDYIIVRTTWVFDMGYDEKNFAVQVYKNLKAGKPMRIVDDQYGNPTLARNIAWVLEEMIIRNKKGIYNIAGADRMSKYDWARAVAIHFKLDRSLLSPISTRSLNQKAPRPLKGDLDVRKSKREFSTKLLTLKESLKYLKPSEK